MQYQLSIPRIPILQPDGPNRQLLTYDAAYTDEQLKQLGEAMQAALGEAFVGFSAVGDEGPTHDITIEWDSTDAGSEVALIDETFNTWSEGLG